MKTISNSTLLSDDLCDASSHCFEIQERDIYLFDKQTEGITAAPRWNAKWGVKEIRTSGDTIKTNREILRCNTTAFSFSFQHSTHLPHSLQWMGGSFLLFFSSNSTANTIFPQQSRTKIWILSSKSQKNLKLRFLHSSSCLQPCADKNRCNFPERNNAPGWSIN